MTATEPPLTRRQAELLRFVARHWGETGCWPTIREIGAAMGMTSPNGVVCHLRLLKAKGAILWEPKPLGEGSKSRGVAIPALLEAARKAAAEWLEHNGGA